MRVSYMELYNENVVDLLRDSGSHLEVREDTVGHSVTTMLVMHVARICYLQVYVRIGEFIFCVFDEQYLDIYLESIHSIFKLKIIIISIQ